MAKSTRVPTLTEAGATEVTAASKAAGSSASRPERKAPASKLSTLPAMVKAALSTLR